jgi:hypothetical protein
MLATDKEAPLIIDKAKKLFFNDKKSVFESIQKAVYQHLYILSNDKIKEGDWYFNQIVTRDINNHITPIGAIPIRCTHESDICNKEKCYKIIASTDSSLIIKDIDTTYKRIKEFLPSIPQSFINRYISKHNKGNKIVIVNHHVLMMSIVMIGLKITYKLFNYV